MQAERRSELKKRFAKDPRDPLVVLWEQVIKIRTTMMLFYAALKATERLLGGLDGAADAVLGANESEKRRAEYKAAAKAEAEAGYPGVYGQVVITTWSALETFFRDVVKAWLSGPAECWTGSTLIAEKVDLRDYERWRSSGVVGEKLFFLVEREARATKSLRAGTPSDRWMGILTALGVKPSDLKREDKDLVRELSLVRNLLAHSPSGTVDERFHASWPEQWERRWPGLKVGDPLQIGVGQASDYASAAVSLAMAVDKAIDKRLDEMASQLPMPPPRPARLFPNLIEAAMRKASEGAHAPAAEGKNKPETESA